MPRTSNRNSPERDEEGRFTSNNRGSQASSRDRDDRADDDTRQSSGRGRGWYGDPEGHAEAGRHSHDNDRGGSRSSSRYDDDDRDYRSSGRSRGRDLSEDEDYADWHAYGHDRGWHAHQQLDGFANRGHRRDDDRQSSGRGRGWFGDPEGHAEAGRHSHDNDRGGARSSGRYEDDDDDRRGRSRSRDDEGRFNGNRH